MASNETYVSSFTGAQIDQAIATYLAGGTAGAATYEIRSVTEWTGNSAPYTISIQATGVFDTGIFPKVFIVSHDDNNQYQYIEPEVIYGDKYGNTNETKGINLTIKSNKKILGTIVWFRMVGV